MTNYRIIEILEKVLYHLESITYIGICDVMDYLQETLFLHTGEKFFIKSILWENMPWDHRLSVNYFSYWWPVSDNESRRNHVKKVIKLYKNGK